MQVLSTYQEAVKVIKENYWVEAIFFGDSGHQSRFDRDYLITAESESGLVHYVKR